MEFVNNSLLSADIAKFYVKDYTKPLRNVETYFCANRTLNFKQIYAECAQGFEVEFGVNQYEHYLDYYKQLLPIYIKSLEIEQGAALDSFDKDLQWLGGNVAYLSKVLEPLESTTDLVLEQVLWLTALLENALANVYYTSTDARTPPHLLRDLLNTAELQHIFGIEAIFFLRTLLGTPHSINLRNIAWHGFTKPNEIPCYYVSTLLLTARTLGFQLAQQGFQLKQRPQIKTFSSYLTEIGRQLNSVAPTSLIAVQHLLDQCSWLDEDYKHYWLHLFQHYQQRNYAQFVVLVLPQIELLLRLCYARANAYDVGAKLDEYYITMDTIFEPNVPIIDSVEMNAPKPNKLFVGTAALSQGVLKCLYDLFIAPSGPRLRDKVSHGEVEVNAINDMQLCCILWHVSMRLLTANELEFPLDAYESNFHLNCQTRNTFVETEAQLMHFIKTHLANSTLAVETNLVLHNMRGEVKIFQRHRKEAEIMLLLLKSTQSMRQVIINYEKSIKERLQLLEKRELHSKRRRTLENLLTALPEIFTTLIDILKCISSIYLSLQHEVISCDNRNELWTLLKFLKHTLKLNENLVKYSGSNEWLKALELCRKFTEVRMLVATELNI